MRRWRWKHRRSIWVTSFRWRALTMEEEGRRDGDGRCDGTGDGKGGRGKKRVGSKGGGGVGISKGDGGDAGGFVGETRWVDDSVCTVVQGSEPRRIRRSCQIGDRIFSARLHDADLGDVLRVRVHIANGPWLAMRPFVRG